jgi:hypothetical protein
MNKIIIIWLQMLLVAVNYLVHVQQS